MVDGSRRSSAYAASVVRAAAPGATVDVVLSPPSGALAPDAGDKTGDADAVVVAVGDPETAASVVAASLDESSPRPVVLAGWLLRPSIAVTSTTSLLFALPADPNGLEAQRYSSVVRSFGSSPTGSGFAAFLASSRGSARPVLVATSSVGVIPAQLGAHPAAGSAWAPGRALVTVARG